MNFRNLNEFLENLNQKMKNACTVPGPAFGPWLQPAVRAAYEAQPGGKSGLTGVLARLACPPGLGVEGR
jgi:hypothetical protein